MIHLLLPKAAIALKRELMQIPLFGWCLRRSGMIGIDRADRMRALRSLIDDGRAALERGASVIIFPEGHASRRAGMCPIIPAWSRSTCELGRPVVPVAHNSGLFWSRRSFLKRPGRIVVQFLEPIEPGLDRKAFMAELEAAARGCADRLIAGGRR